MRVAIGQRQVAEHEAQPVAHPSRQLPDGGLGRAAVGALVVAVLHERDRRVPAAEHVVALGIDGRVEGRRHPLDPTPRRPSRRGRAAAPGRPWAPRARFSRSSSRSRSRSTSRITTVRTRPSSRSSSSAARSTSRSWRRSVVHAPTSDSSPSGTPVRHCPASCWARTAYISRARSSARLGARSRRRGRRSGRAPPRPCGNAPSPSRARRGARLLHPEAADQRGQREALHDERHADHREHEEEQEVPSGERRARGRLEGHGERRGEGDGAAHAAPADDRPLAPVEPGRPARRSHADSSAPVPMTKARRMATTASETASAAPRRPATGSPSSASSTPGHLEADEQEEDRLEHEGEHRPERRGLDPRAGRDVLAPSASRGRSRSTPRRGCPRGAAPRRRRRRGRA